MPQEDLDPLAQTDLFESLKQVRIVLNNFSSLPQDNCSFSYHGPTNPHFLFTYKILSLA